MYGPADVKDCLMRAMEDAKHGPIFEANDSEYVTQTGPLRPICTMEDVRYVLDLAGEAYAKTMVPGSLNGQGYLLVMGENVRYNQILLTLYVLLLGGASVFVANYDELPSDLYFITESLRATCNSFSAQREFSTKVILLSPREANAIRHPRRGKPGAGQLGIEHAVIMGDVRNDFVLMQDYAKQRITVHAPTAHVFVADYSSELAHLDDIPMIRDLNRYLMLYDTDYWAVRADGNACELDGILEMDFYDQLFNVEDVIDEFWNVKTLVGKIPVVVLTDRERATIDIPPYAAERYDVVHFCDFHPDELRYDFSTLAKKHRE